ncbi:DNA polymerase zeta catalytic subunit [Papilio machaon]|uniref:DNA polymerase n=1 Tax=Papilio machaon TaxID=76193 RepID=A0A194RND0_PAPMA|nr:DNA polymerase zeta catalytic subunit [Papilio machaon]
MNSSSISFIQNTDRTNLTDSSLSKKPEFSIRIVVCDYYLTKPVPGVDVIYSEFRGSDIKQVPVLRIFGPTPSGRKACLHIHGVFPYFYLPCPTSNPEPQFLYQIAASLDKAINIALKQATSVNQHVYKISLVKGLPFYGFHDKEHLYLKIFLYNPGLIRQAVDLCSNGAILGQSLQPHESLYSEFRGSDIKQVPVLRIFGPTPSGRKACLHIHGVFPYFYLPCPTSNPEPQFLYQIAASLDKAINIALKQATSVNQHVYKISLVKGLPFYGFHDKEHLYLKIFLYNPGLIRQAVDLCSNGAILGQSLQPHESHLNFTLQFFIDFNLFGMSNIDLQSVKFRRNGLSQSSNDPLDEIDEINLKPESICYFEADCVASQIINRQRIGKADGIENPGLEEVWNQEMERRKQLDISLASKSLTQSQNKTDETDSHYKYQNMFLVKNSNLINKPIEIDSKVTNEPKIHYPAEMTMVGSQLYNATDVSTHLPENTNQTLNKTLRSNSGNTNLDSTVVDEDIALNSSFSLHYSQVLLDSEDFELVDMLQDLDDKPIDDDSVMGTQQERAEEVNSDAELDKEYSQIFNDDTICLDPEKCESDAKESTPSWNDTFWDGANISQLDGTCDDDHVKKVRKRKMRSFKLGLSRPKTKKSSKTDGNKKLNKNLDTETIETEQEINELEISESKASIVTTSKNALGMSIDVLDISLNNEKPEEKVINTNMSITELVKIQSEKSLKLEPAIEYDKQKKFEPVAGPSKPVVTNKMKIIIPDNSINDSFDSSPEEDVGIKSFYDTSKFIDTSLEIDASLSPEAANSPSNNVTVEQNPIKNEICENNKIKQEIEDDEALSDKKIIITPKIKPPTTNYVISTCQKYSIPENQYLKPFFSNYKDVGDKIEIGHMLIKLQSHQARDMNPFEKVLNTTSIEEWRQLLFLQQTNEMPDDIPKPEILKSLLAGNKQYILEPIKKPPTTRDVSYWIKQQDKESKPPTTRDVNDWIKQQDKESTTESNIDCKEISKDIDELESSQVIGLNEDEINSSLSLESTDKDITKMTNSLQVMQPDGSFLCFGSTDNQSENILDSPAMEVDFLTLMLVEVHTSVRLDLNPDPSIDPIQAIFITVKNYCPTNHFLQNEMTEILVIDSLQPPKLLDRCVFNSKVTYVENEIKCIEKLIKSVKENDPDILCGYDIEMNSWGYIIERAQNLGIEVIMEISRITEKHRQKRWRNDESELEGRVIGRITFNVWRLFRHELALSSYSFENCMYVILNERVPTYSYAQLAEWWNDESRILRWIPVEYYLTKLSGTVRMLEKLDMINRTSELARLFGLQWWEVLSRGSQFRVESLMLRAARPLNLVALSPTVRQRAAMRAPECLPLIFEPGSQFRVESLMLRAARPLNLVALSPTVRQRAAMRAPECLPLIFEPESRFYSDPVIVLDFQSLYPSMMIAYNYCFSTCIGRVQNINGDAPYEFGAWRLRIPKSKLDTLVGNGLVHWSPVGVGFIKSSVRRGVLPALLRRILAARQAVKKNMKLQTDEAVKKAMHSRQLGLKLIANVTYGYTAANFSGRMPCVEVGDSVVAKGRETLERAIKLVDNNTKWNAKVIYGDTDSMFVLIPGASRQRAFEIGQEIADAVTADNPSPVVLKLEKLLQRSLCELFETGDMSRVKRVVCATLARLADGTLPLHELFFTREYHGPAGYKSGAAVPPNEIAKRLICRDPRSVPRAGWRVSWLVCAGAPGTALSRLARSPRELLRQPATPHVLYYATRVLLPPLHRCLSLLGVHVFNWWKEVGEGREIQLERASAGRGGGIARYMERGRCAVCGARGARSLCSACARPQALLPLATRLARSHTHLQHCYDMCRTCTGHSECQQCENTECPVLWRRLTAQQKLDEIRDVFNNLPPHLTLHDIHF